MKSDPHLMQPNNINTSWRTNSAIEMVQGVDDKAGLFWPRWCFVYEALFLSLISLPMTVFLVARPVGVWAELICQWAFHSVKDECR